MCHPQLQAWVPYNGVFVLAQVGLLVAVKAAMG